MIIKETERLRIEQATITDANFFFELLNCTSWIEFIGDRGIKTKMDAEAYIEKSLFASYRENGFGLWKVSLKKFRTPIGICGFLKRDYLDDPDIGFALLPEHERKGYMTEACEAVLAYGSSELNFADILAVTTQANTKCRRLLTKLEFYERGTVLPTGSDSSLLLYAISKE